MQAAGGVAHVVGEVDRGRHGEIREGRVHVAQAGRHRRVDARREGGAVAGDRLVVLVVRAHHLARQLVGEHVAEHHRVRLLDDLRAQRHLAAEEDVRGHRSRAQLLDGDLVHLMEPRELLVDEGLGVEAVHQGVGNLRPLGELAVPQGEAGAQGPRPLRVGAFQPHERLRRAADVPAREDVRVGVVVDALVVFVGADDGADMAAAVGVAAGARGPEAGRFEQELDAHRRHEVVVGRPLPVLPDRPGDVGGDVVLHEAREDRHYLPVGTEAVGRRHLDALVG